MTAREFARTAYSRAEHVSDAVVHLSGLVLVALAVPVLIVLTAVQRGDAPALFGVSVYGTALIAMIGFSALYNLTPRAALRWLFQRLDHAAIYIKIAGTYTPFALLSGQGLVLTIGVWTAALLGVVMKMISPQRWRGFGIALYLGMGWVGVAAAPFLLAGLPWAVLLPMGLGGALYTAGVGFYLWQRLPFHYTIWHVLVLLASVSFYAAVLLLVLGVGGSGA